METYGIEEIKSLDFREGVRTRIQMYLGSDDINGVYQAFKEILNNSTDEATAGYGNEIQVGFSQRTNTFKIRDFGRGVPFGMREDGENVLVSIYSKSHTGGKFEDGAYKNASGLNGIGGKCVCLSALTFTVDSYRDKRHAQATWKQGILQAYTEEDNNTGKTGTLITFTPDPEVFVNGQINCKLSALEEQLHNISYLYPNITFQLTDLDSGDTKKFCCPHGIEDFVKDTVKKPVNAHIITGSATDEETGDKVEIAFQWGDGKEKAFTFVNGLHCPENGSPLTGAKSAITRTFNYLSGLSLDGDIIRTGLFYVINCSVAHPSFANQTKSAVNNANLYTLASNAFNDALKQFKARYIDEFNALVEMLKRVAKADEAAEKARQDALTKEVEKNQKRKVFSSDKLKDAEKLGQNATLLLVEGLSAASAIAKARDTDNYGILSLRGKIINSLSNTEADFYDNEEVRLLLSAMNIIPGKYDSTKLRYGKLGICVDADSDGYSIGLLIMCALMKIAPDFINEGRLYWLRSPLYIVSNGKKNYYYYTDDEYQARTISGETARIKGLGGMTAQQAHESMFTAAFQRLDQLCPDADSFDVLKELMGTDVSKKHDFIFNNIDFSEIRE